MGFGPQLVDLNGDGHVDLLSGSWPGELFLFRGGPERTFAAPEMIKDKDGNYINIGGGFVQRPDGRITITGHAEFKQDEDGTHYVMYHGKRLDSTPENPISVTGTASAVHAADWDGDGDYDLLVGDIRGNVYLVPNEAPVRRTSKSVESRKGPSDGLESPSYAFGEELHLQAGGKPLRVDGDAGPFAADWDGDGDLDLLVGAGDGSVSLFKNTGSATHPQLAAAEQLVPPGKVSYGAAAPKEPQRGTRSKVCAVDWNGDGLLDLLVGDFTTQKPDLPEPTPEEKAEHDKIRAELSVLQKRFGELFSMIIGPNRPKTKEELDKVHKESRELSDKIQALHAKLPPEYENHGWVWLFVRKPREE